MRNMKDQLTKNEKISLAMTGRTLSDEHKENLALAKKGTKRTDATRGKIKQTLLGNKASHIKISHPLIPKTSKSRSHLTAIQVKEIRDRYSNEKDASIRRLAQDYNVSRHTIHSIVTYKVWK